MDGRVNESEPFPVDCGRREILGRGWRRLAKSVRGGHSLNPHTNILIQKNI